MGSSWNTPLSQEAIANTISLAKESFGGNPELFGNIDLTGHTASSLASDLTRVIIEHRLFTPKYKYLLVRMYGMRAVENGATFYDYAEFTDGDTRGAREANTIEDFNASYEPMLREAFKVAEKIHKKNKLPELILADAWGVASGITGFVMVQRESNVRAISKAIELKAWTEMVDGATFVEVVPEAGEDEDKAIAKAMYNDLTTYETTSHSHKGVGTDGVITVNTINGAQTIQPEEYFDSTEFDVIARPAYKTGITFESDATYFNWEATQKQLHSYNVLDFDKYSAIPPAIATALVGSKVIMNHMERMDMLEFFNYQSTVKGASAFEVIHNFSEYDVYLRKDRPTIIYYISTPAVEELVSKSEHKTYPDLVKAVAKKTKVQIRKGTIKAEAIAKNNGDETSSEDYANELINSLDKMSKAELLNEATKKGLVVPTNSKKADLILAITNA